MELFTSAHRAKHQFTVAYSPWINGTVENTYRHVRAACTALLTELKLAPQDWSTVIPLISSILNEAPLQRLRFRQPKVFRTPLEVMTGTQPCRSPLISIVSSSKLMELKSIRAEQLVSV